MPLQVHGVILADYKVEQRLQIIQGLGLSAVSTVQYTTQWLMESQTNPFLGSPLDICNLGLTPQGRKGFLEDNGCQKGDIKAFCTSKCFL
jgi:hypothetical protein